MDQGMHVSAVHLRFVDHHLMGSGHPPLPLSIPRKKGYIPSGEGVGGYKTAAMSFDGDGIHSLANTENKMPEIPKPTVLVLHERVHVSRRGVVEGEFRVMHDLNQAPQITRAEFGDMKRIAKTLQGGYNFTCFQQNTTIQLVDVFTSSL